MRSRVTIKDVARMAEVGASTVSRVVHDSERVAPETRNRVLAAIAQLGYKPNLVARGLVQQNTRTVALVVPPIEPHVYPIIDGAGARLAAEDYTVLLYRPTIWQEETHSFRWIDQNWLVDGILVYSFLHHDDVPADILQMQAEGLPVVFINNFSHEPHLNSASTDNFQAARLVVQHLAGLGHRRIGMLTGDQKSVDGTERCQGFKAALKELGLPIHADLICDALWQQQMAYDMARQFLDLPSPPTALFCGNDHMALGVLQAASDMGVRVPEDLSIVGFDDLEAARYCRPTLTTVRAPLREVGARAVDLIMQVIDDPARPPEQHALPAQLVVRESTAAPREN